MSLLLPPSFSSCAELLARPTVAISQDTATEQRENVTFCCSTPDADVTIPWVFNDLPLVFRERMQLATDGKTLTILTVQREDSGTYKCEAQAFRQVRSSAPTFLTVNCKSLSILPSPSSTPPSLVISFSLTASDTIQMWTRLPLDSRRITI